MNTINRQNTAIVIVTYNPDSIFYEALKIHRSIVDTIIVVDNGSSNIKLWEHLLRPSELIKSNINKGIGWALNTGIRKAKSLGIQYIISFDQDSKPLKNILDLYSSCFTNDVALMGSWFNPHVTPVEKINMRNSLTVITSGCLHNLSLIDKVGWYNQELFIDGVDFDYAIRCHDNGYRVLRSEEPLIAHRLGNPIKRYGIISSNHSATRKYYISRNTVILSKKYFIKHPIWITKKNFFFFLDLIKMILLEDNVKTKVKQVINGLKDGILFNLKRKS